ncbi:MAG: hypothetical protein ABW168_24010 [Sedimenticola sp.]
MEYADWSTISTRQGIITRVPLRNIREGSRILKQTRLHMLQNGFNNFSEIINDPHWSGMPANDAIKLEGTKLGMMNVLEGNHRIHLANQLGYTSVWAVVN